MNTHIQFGVPSSCNDVSSEYKKNILTNNQVQPSKIKAIVNKIHAFITNLFNHFFYRHKHKFKPYQTSSNTGIFTTNDVIVSNSAEKSFEWKKELVESAKKSIELSGNFAGGEKFREFLTIVKKRLKESSELKVHILLSSDLLENTDIKVLKELKKCNGRFEYLITDKIYSLTPSPKNEENHVKLLIVDEKYFVMGGTGIHQKMTREKITNDDTNFKSTFSSLFIDKAFRDTDLIGTGESAKIMREQFFNLYKIWEYRMTGNENFRKFEINGKKGICTKFSESKELNKNVKVKYLVAGPEHKKNNPITLEYQEQIKNSKENIKIGNLLFNPEKEIKTALKDRKNNNVEINGYFNGTGKNSSSLHYIYALPNRTNYHFLSSAFEYQEKDRLYHKKVATFDDKVTIIGSYNLGYKSAYCDYENICVIDNEAVTKIVNESLKEDESVSKKYKENMRKSYFNYFFGKAAIVFIAPFYG